MHLHATPSLAAEVPGFSQEQLDRLARSVEARRQQLEEDINAYIQRKQDELRQYETELVEQHRSMERDEDPGAASRRSSAASERTEDSAEQPEQPEQSQQPAQSQASREEQKKQKKHGRVHKREKELYGLVTPVFLPLLDARESTSPTKKERKPAKQEKPTDASSAPAAEQSTRAREAESGREGRTSQKENKDTGSDMAGETAVKERSASDPVKKSRRSSIKKKSALRHSSTPRNRKRVSLVIDDQVVLPSDMIQEPALTSPSSDTTSATNSSASLDEMIDPRLTSPDAPVYIEHHEAVHHSLPLTVSQPKPLPVKASAPSFSNPAPVVAEAAHAPPTSPGIRSPTMAYAPPSYATRSFLDPPPECMHIEDIPATAGPDPIHPDEKDPEDQQLPSVEATEENFSTYVGGISGRGVDDVNQVGSVGYPSSLGASYLESYMQGRPLSVRMAAAEREGNEGEIRRLRSMEARRKKRENDERKEKEKIDEDDWDAGVGRGGAGDDDGFMGSMDDF
ncbi:hypothetical protein BU25DRAFT_413351 [Macroventuria anomochaeta]|uniref:Uncharacterized protein n=1 Tax=Macroventuria anomochaeta TaxID=301207 RepID=A0ACB6RSD6_9PLEO|nr:uncharacterized protein BU25DRAFT_413351 [Macroventuria anomochaeta]KAF2624811.1 hypothetical protein BU25DRAFT_413351 [Macroventuria anomochaeta]